MAGGARTLWFGGLVILVAWVGACASDEGGGTCRADLTGKVVINEVYYDEAAGEVAFIELRGDPGLSLNCLSIVGRQGNGTCEESVRLRLRGLTLPTDGYLVIAAAPTATAELVDPKANFQNGPDGIELVDDCCNGLIVDALAYGPVNCPDPGVGEGDAAGTVEKGESLSRYPDGSDSGRNTVDFCAAPPSPGRPNEQCGGPLPGCSDAAVAVGAVVITEVMANPQFSPDWFELHNPAGEAVTLRKDCCIVGETGTTAHADLLTQDVELSPGGYAVFASKALDAACNVPIAYDFGSLSLVASGAEDLYVACVVPPENVPVDADSVEFEGVTYTVIDSVTYDFSAAGAEKGYSLSVCPDAATAEANDDPQEWAPADPADLYCTLEGSEYGTPGGPSRECPGPGTPCGPGECQFTELLIAPAESAKEWLEVCNCAAEPRDLQGCRLQEGGAAAGTVDNEYTLPARSVLRLEPGQCALLTTGSCIDQPQPCGEYRSVSFNNTKHEFLELMCPAYDASGERVDVDGDGDVDEADMQQIDRVEYSLGNKSPTRTGYTWNLSADAVCAGGPAPGACRWCEADEEAFYDNVNRGTPGTTNRLCPAAPRWPGAGELVFTEILPDAVTGTGEWMELFNPTGQDFDLQGCRLAKTPGTTGVSYAIPLALTATVQADSHFILAKAASACDAATGCDPTACEVFGDAPCLAYGTITMPDDTPDVRIALLCPLGGADGSCPEAGAEVEVAAVVYNPTGGEEAVDGCSHQLSGDGYGPGVTPGDNWCTTPVCESASGVDNVGSPGAHNPDCPPPLTPPKYGDLIFTEIMADAEGESDWLELHSLVADVRDVRGCKLVRESGSTFEDDTLPDTLATQVAANGYLVLHEDACPPEFAGFCASFGSVTLPKTTADVSVRLFCPCPPASGACVPCDPAMRGCEAGLFLVDAVQYNVAGGPQVQDAYSLSLAPTGFSAAANDEAGNWCQAASDATYAVGSGNHGTPGAANPACPGPAAYPAPGEVIITEVMIDPESYSSNDGEWFEVHNIASGGRELQGCRLSETTQPGGTEHNYLVPIETPVPIVAGGYVVFGRSGGGLLPGWVPYSSLGFNDTDPEALVLTCPDAAGTPVEIDRVVYNATGARSVPTGYSWSLSSAWLSGVGNDDPAHWCAAADAALYDTHQNRGTPGQANAACP